MRHALGSRERILVHKRDSLVHEGWHKRPRHVGVVIHERRVFAHSHIALARRAERLVQPVGPLIPSERLFPEVEIAVLRTLALD
jgi:hypothetical protein